MADGDEAGHWEERCWRCRSPLVGRRLSVTEITNGSEDDAVWGLCSWACVGALVATRIVAADPADQSHRRSRPT